MGLARGARRLAGALPYVALVAASAAGACALAALAGARQQRRRQRRQQPWAAVRGGEPCATAAPPPAGESCGSGELDSPGPSAQLLVAAWGAGPYGSALSRAVSAALEQLWAMAPPRLSARHFIQQLRSIWFNLAGVAGAGAGAQAGGGEARVVDRATLEAVCGEWSKDFRRCEPMDDFFSLFGVSMLLRKAARLMRGMRIELKGDTLEVTQICALRWLSVTEAFPLAPHAAPGEHRRRDLRRGPQRGTLEGAAAGAVRVRVEWGAPLEGCAVDEMRLVPAAQRRGGRRGAGGGGRDALESPGDGGASPVDGPMELHVTSTAWVGGDKARFKWVCVRRGCGGEGGDGGGGGAAA